ncbi:hypothetical protein SDC9_112971 [bioreactor metagenome]|uniref:Uncharacterized protein n=1 Tax=bioreactor metagenome TaxID=1076179 RepID=A0A645BLB1_9ZZZZ
MVLRARAEVLPAAAPEPVGENLINDPLAPALRRFKRAVVNGDLVSARLVLPERAFPAVRSVIERLPVLQANDEIVPNQTGRFGHRQIRCRSAAGNLHIEKRFTAVLVIKTQLNAGIWIAAFRFYMHAAAAGSRALRPAKGEQPRMMPKINHTLIIPNGFPRKTSLSGMLRGFHISSAIVNKICFFNSSQRKIPRLAAEKCAKKLPAPQDFLPDTRAGNN